MRTKKILFIVLTALIAVSMLGAQTEPPEAGECTSILVGKLASIDGSVMTTHTCDGWDDSRVTVVPRGTHKDGEMVQIWKTWKDQGYGAPAEVRGEIPQVSETNSYIQSAYPFMNEYQVSIGESTFSGRRELVNADQGLFYLEPLMAIALQRGKTAREVVQIMGSLAEKYGYADGGECLTVADPNEGWVFEIVGPGPLWTADSETPGAVWVAQRVADDRIFVSANRSRIGEIDLSKPDWFMASPNIFETAKTYSFWDGKTVFRFNDVYAPKDTFYNSRREWRVFSILAPSRNFDAWAKRYPFSVKPDKKVSVRDIIAITRDHYEGTQFDLTKGLDAGPFGSPDRWASKNPTGTTGWERSISIYRCAYTFVSQSRSWLPDAIGGCAWFGEGAPHSTVYMPIYAGITEVPKSLSTHERFEYSRLSARWAFDFVENWSQLSYSYMIKDIQAKQAKYENEFFDMQPAIEGAALAMYNNKSPELAKSFLTSYSNDAINRAVNGWWVFADELVAKYNQGGIFLKSKGYPEEWLKAVKFGESSNVKLYKDIVYPDD
ncbi:MAG: C69 family dipeptidase [Rectinemataceae bacterium]